VDGNEEFADVTNEDGGNGEEELHGGEHGALGIGVRGKASEGGDARGEIDDEGHEEWGKLQRERAKNDGAHARKQKLVTNEDAGKQKSGLFTEERGEKEKGGEKDRANGRRRKPGATVKEHGEEQEEGTLEFGKCSDPGNGLGMDGMQSEPEGGPKGEHRGAEGSDQEIEEGDDGGVQENVDEMPGEGMRTKEAVLGGVGERLQGPIIIAGGFGILLAFVSECPNVAGESSAEVLAFQNQGILEDLELVVGNELVAESGGVEGDGKEDKESEVKAVPGWRSGRCDGSR